ncbi:MAG: M1 family metallopeptidase [Sphingobacteriaceae bacterium]|nr:M1 family metallopeptidase [Sphingobacteriaceae bacterium]
MKQLVLSKIAVGLWLSALLSACTSNPFTETMESPYIADPHSYARPDESRVDALHLDLRVDFEQRQLRGAAVWTLAPEHGDSLVLDTYDLNIDSVLVDLVPVAFTLSSKDPILGQALTLPLTPTAREVRIVYSTQPGARALQWLEPSQTAGKKHPFLFTQSQAILARTWLPCQDSPGLRYRYTANIQAPAGMMALMSATNPTKRSSDGRYSFEMEIPVPAYLMALAVGDIDFKAVGPRTGVYAEPSMLEKSVYEFGEMEAMLEAAEALYGPYAWGKYDVLVLPPSFPFGGMENPRLTFATPTILTGDRSLVSLIAHELAHSWSGNLVTNATWNDFWLNEGFTVYFENRIMEAVYGSEYAEMLAGIGYADMVEEIAELEAKGELDKTSLKANMAGTDPDDGVGPIAYDKGYHFLRLIDETVGRKRFDDFLRNYFTENAFSSMHTERFVQILKDSLGAEALAGIDIDDWIYGTGLPANCPKPVSPRFTRVDAARAKFIAGESVDQQQYAAWSTHEWVYFIRGFSAAETRLIPALDEQFSFSTSTNAEILSVWFSYVMKNQPGYAKKNGIFYKALEQFLVEVGRRKFLMPTYKAMKESGSIDLAKSIYAKARPNYHAVARQSVDALLGE